ncbi:MAG: molybdopterin molybdotransferase MoeA, partial [Proteobacteria bacterium]|nr:molybdopterin molybdotransferase MoeA [Pseudomonadota bacterium]
AVLPALDVRRIGLGRAVGRVLAEDVRAGFAVPPTDNSAVDGVALRSTDLLPAGVTRLRLVGRAAAGHPFERPLGTGEAVRIFTGASLPADADTVVMTEDVTIENDQAAVPQGLKPGANRRRMGEDVKPGDLVLKAGIRLRAQDVGMAAAMGRVSLPVMRRLRAAVFSTGDEVAEPGRPKRTDAIYDSNRYGLAALLSGLGCRVTDMGILPDRFEAVRSALINAAADHDVMVTSGGVSLGDEDHLKSVLAAEGRIVLWRLAIKPGRPVAVGEIRGTPVLGLPGNPVAALVTFMMVARPMLLRLSGVAPGNVWPHAYMLPALFDFTGKKTGRTEFLRGFLVQDGQHVAGVDRFPREGSGLLTSMVAANGLIWLNDGHGPVARGHAVPFVPFAELDV